MNSKNLSKIRTPESNLKLSTKIQYSVFIFVLGITLGIFSKWLDNMSIDDTIWWQHILGIFDLRNVFSMLAIWFLLALIISIYSKTPLRASVNVFLYFAGMCISYHLYTILFAGFNPRRYMMIWYGLTLLSPLLAFVCWYGKGKTNISLAINIFVLSVMIRVCFSIGLWYFDFTGIINTLIFIASIIVLYSTPPKTAITIVGAVVLAFGMKLIV